MSLPISSISTWVQRATATLKPTDNRCGDLLLHTTKAKLGRLLASQPSIWCCETMRWTPLSFSSPFVNCQPATKICNYYVCRFSSGSEIVLVIFFFNFIIVSSEKFGITECLANFAYKEEIMFKPYPNQYRYWYILYILLCNRLECIKNNKIITILQLLIFIDYGNLVNLIKIDLRKQVEVWMIWRTSLIYPKLIYAFKKKYVLGFLIMGFPQNDMEYKFILNWFMPFFKKNIC